MDIEVGGHVAFDLVEKFAELLRTMANHAFADDGPGLNIECGKQGSCAVSRVIVRAPLDLSWSHRQKRLGTVERLHLALLVDT